MIDFESIKDKLAWKDLGKKKRIQAEILVPNRIGLDMIMRICCISKSSLEEVKRLCNNSNNLPICVDKSNFFAVARGFFYTNSSVLTNEIITKENVDSKRFSNKRIFSIKSDNQIVVLVNIQAIPNLEYEFIWKDEFNNEVRKTNNKGLGSTNYYIWDNLEMGKMKCGNFIVSFFLNDIRQFTIPFEILEV